MYEPPYSLLESPCPRCDHVEHLVLGLDLCKACFEGYLAAKRDDWAEHVIKISQQSGVHGTFRYRALCRCGASPGSWHTSRKQAVGRGQAHVKAHERKSEK